MTFLGPYHEGFTEKYIRNKGRRQTQGGTEQRNGVEFDPSIEIAGILRAHTPYTHITYRNFFPQILESHNFVIVIGNNKIHFSSPISFAEYPRKSQMRTIQGESSFLSSYIKIGQHMA